MKIYLSGGMEYAEEVGVGWRQAITPLIEEIGYEVIDPTKEDQNEKLLGMSIEEFNDLKLNNLDEYKEIIRKQIVTPDILQVLDSDIVLVYYDEAAQSGAGTISEIFYAYLIGKPVIIVTVVETIKIPGWLLAEVSRQFTSFDVVVRFLANEHLVNDLITRCKLSAVLDPMLLATNKYISEFLLK